MTYQKLPCQARLPCQGVFLLGINSLDKVNAVVYCKII